MFPVLLPCSLLSYRIHRAGCCHVLVQHCCLSVRGTADSALACCTGDRPPQPYEYFEVLYSYDGTSCGDTAVVLIYPANDVNLPKLDGASTGTKPSIRSSYDRALDEIIGAPPTGTTRTSFRHY